MSSRTVVVLLAGLAALANAVPFSSLGALYPELASTLNLFQSEGLLSNHTLSQNFTVFVGNSLTFNQTYYQSIDPRPEAQIAALQYSIVPGLPNLTDFYLNGAGDSLVLQTALTSSEFTDLQQGAQLLVTKDNNGLHTNGGLGGPANLVLKPIPFDNGQVYVKNRLNHWPLDLNLTGQILGFDSFLEFFELDNPGVSNVTIFAPSNQALADFKSQNNNADPTAEQLKSLIIPNQVLYAQDLVNLGAASNEHGTRFTFTKDLDNILTVTDSSVVTKSIHEDILIMNGVVHVVDKFLM